MSNIRINFICMGIIQAEVESQTEKKVHNVDFNVDKGWFCTCGHYSFSKTGAKPLCKHMLQVIGFLESCNIHISEKVYQGKILSLDEGGVAGV